MVGVLEWDESDRNRIMRQFQWEETPDTQTVRLAQEDLWVYEALLRIIEKTNKGATLRERGDQGGAGVGDRQAGGAELGAESGTGDPAGWPQARPPRAPAKRAALPQAGSAWPRPAPRPLLESARRRALRHLR